MFNEEQVKRLNEISKLDGSKQQAQLSEFLKQLTPEQIAYLKKQDKCLFCEIANKKIESIIVYEDNEVMAAMDINPVSPGHVIIMTKKHEGKFDNKVIEKLKKAVMDSLDAENIEMKAIKNGHALLHLIPRYGQEMKAGNDKQELVKIAGMIKDKLNAVMIPEKINDEIKIIKIDEDDFWLQSRIP